MPLCGALGGWGPRKGPEYYLDLSRAAFAAGRPGDAEEPLRRAVAKALPGSGKRARARALLGLALLKQGRTAEAGAECDRLRDEAALAQGAGRSDGVGAWAGEAAGFNRGLVQDVSGQHAAAVDTYTAAAAAASSNIDALLGRALALRSLRRYREAARDYIAVLGSSPAAPPGPGPPLPWGRRSESRPASPGSAEAAGSDPRPGGSGSEFLGRSSDPELLRLLRQPAAARDERDVAMIAGLLADVTFFRSARAHTAAPFESRGAAARAGASAGAARVTGRPGRYTRITGRITGRITCMTRMVTIARM